MQTKLTPRKTVCLMPSGRSVTQMLRIPTDESTSTDTSTGQLVAIASCSQRRRMWGAGGVRGQSDLERFHASISRLGPQTSSFQLTFRSEHWLIIPIPARISRERSEVALLRLFFLPAASDCSWA